MPQAELPNLGITPQWLNENAGSVLRGEMGCDFTKEQNALLLPRFTNLQEVQPLLPHLLEPGITDDYPSIVIEILKNGETVWQFGSSSQSHLFMLPWAVATPKESFTSYNAEIGRRLARLLPEQFVNRDRLSGANLSRELGGLVATRFLDLCEAIACKPCPK